MSEEFVMVANWALKLTITCWVGFSIIVLATFWYLATAIRPLVPDWWRRVVVDEDLKFDEVWIIPDTKHKIKSLPSFTKRIQE